MLLNLSYINLFASVIYFLLFLQNGGILAIIGVLMVAAFNIATIYQMRNETHKWNLFQFIFSIPALAFSAFLLYSSSSILISAAEHRYYSRDVLLLVGLSSVFAFAILLQMLLAGKFKVA